LAQPLTTLVTLLELWQAGAYADEPQAAIRARLELAADELVRRYERIARVRSYTPRVRAGFVVLDLHQAAAP
jgi:hypothetical protein